MEVKPKGRKRTNQAAFDVILKAGRKPVDIKKKDWKLATPPGAFILRKYLKREYEVRTLADDSGWRIKQV